MFDYLTEMIKNRLEKNTTLISFVSTYIFVEVCLNKRLCYVLEGNCLAHTSTTQV